MKTYIEFLEEILEENEQFFLDKNPKIKTKCIIAAIRYAATALDEAAESADIDFDGSVDKQSILKNIYRLN